MMLFFFFKCFNTFVTIQHIQFMKIDNNDFINFINGKTKGFENIFHHIYPTLISFASRHSINTMIAEDIVMETFNKAWEIREDMESSDSLKSYLYRSVHNKAMNAYRDLKNRERILQERYDGNKEEYFKELVIEEEVHRLLYNEIENLPDKCKKILKLNMKGLTLPEIAEDLNISINTVKTHKKRAVSILRNKFKNNRDVLILICLIFSDNIN